MIQLLPTDKAHVMKYLCIEHLTQMTELNQE